MTRWIALAALGLAVAACTPADQDLVARETAKATLTPMVQSRLPGIPVTNAVNCAIDNASAPEIVTLASATLTGVTPATEQTATTVLTRPATLDCIARDGLNTILGGQGRAVGLSLIHISEPTRPY